MNGATFRIRGRPPTSGYIGNRPLPLP